MVKKFARIYLVMATKHNYYPCWGVTSPYEPLGVGILRTALHCGDNTWNYDRIYQVPRIYCRSLVFLSIFSSFAFLSRCIWIARVGMLCLFVTSTGTMAWHCVVYSPCCITTTYS